MATYQTNLTPWPPWDGGRLPKSTNAQRPLSYADKIRAWLVRVELIAFDLGYRPGGVNGA